MVHALFAILNTARAGEAYYTGFETPPFNLGPDKIRGTDGWSGPMLFAGKALSGILSEAQHGVTDIGNAAYLGGNPARVTGVNNKSVYLRRAVNLDPVALGQEVASFSVVFGIKDSTADSLFRRDNFEFQIWNSNSQLLGGIQFDNNRLDSLTGLPLRSIYLLYWNGSAFVYTNTGYSFLPETLEVLDFRINFRTNRWTVTVGGAPLFQDISFYTGPNLRNLGSAVAQMQVTNCHLTVGPGDHVIRTVTLTGLLPTESNNSMTITNSIASRGPSHTFTGPLASAHAVEPGHDCPTPTMQLQLDVQRLTIRAQKAEHKLEALTSEFGQYQAWVRQTRRTQGKILEELEQRMRETQAELETLRPKTLELHSSGDSTTVRSPRRRKIQKP